MGGGKLSEIEDPCLNDRENYITHYPNSHWNLDEMKKGIILGESNIYRLDHIV